MSQIDKKRLGLRAGLAMAAALFLAGLGFCADTGRSALPSPTTAGSGPIVPPDVRPSPSTSEFQFGYTRRSDANVAQPIDIQQQLQRGLLAARSPFVESERDFYTTMQRCQQPKAHCCAVWIEEKDGSEELVVTVTVSSGRSWTLKCSPHESWKSCSDRWMPQILGRFTELAGGNPSAR